MLVYQHLSLLMVEKRHHLIKGSVKVVGVSMSSVSD